MPMLCITVCTEPRYPQVGSCLSTDKGEMLRGETRASDLTARMHASHTTSFPKATGHERTESSSSQHVTCPSHQRECVSMPSPRSAGGSSSAVAVLKCGLLRPQHTESRQPCTHGGGQAADVAASDHCPSHDTAHLSHRWAIISSIRLPDACRDPRDRQRSSRRAHGPQLRRELSARPVTRSMLPDGAIKPFLRPSLGLGGAFDWSSVRCVTCWRSNRAAGTVAQALRVRC